MSRRGQQIRIESIEKLNGTKRFERINAIPFRGRPSKVYKRLIEFAFLNGLFNEQDFYEDLLVHGFDKGYISDGFLAAFVLKYFLKDMNWTKEQRMKQEEIENGRV